MTCWCGAPVYNGHHCANGHLQHRWIAPLPFVFLALALAFACMQGCAASHSPADAITTASSSAATSQRSQNACALPCAKLRAIGCGAEQPDRGASFEASCFQNCPTLLERGIFTDAILQCLVDLPSGSDCTNVSDCAPAL